MFGFGKKKKKEEENNKDISEQPDKKKKKTRVDKIVMGAILGVAIGSVISASLAPKKKKNKETDELLEEEELEEEEEETNPKENQKHRFRLFEKKKDKNKAALAKKLKKIPNEFE